MPGEGRTCRWNPNRKRDDNVASLRPAHRVQTGDFRDQISVEPHDSTTVEFVIGLDNTEFPLVRSMFKNLAARQERHGGSVYVVANGSAIASALPPAVQGCSTGWTTASRL
jgi:hypothetical protein